MKLSNTVAYYLGGSVFTLVIAATFFASYQSNLKRVREQGFESGQQSMVRFARRNLESVLNINCKTEDDEIYSLPLFHGIYSDPNNTKNPDALAMNMYCDSPDRPTYPQVPKGDSPDVISIEIPEDQMSVRWGDYERRRDNNWILPPTGLKTFRERAPRP